MIFLTEILAKAWQNRDPFDVLFSLEGEEYRRVKSRRTFRFEIDGQGFFAKVHRGIGYREIFKNLFSLKLPVAGAENEYRALLRLKEFGIPAMEVAGFGTRGRNIAHRESFLVTRELKNMQSLEEITLHWAETPPDSALRHTLIRRLAETSGAMHRAGINHRDCYLCHFLTAVDDPEKTLHIIDLHRAQCRQKVPYRYQVKDVAGLLFSSMNCAITRRDVLRFVRLYSRTPLREEFARNGKFYCDVARTAEKLYRKEFGKEPPRWF